MESKKQPSLLSLDDVVAALADGGVVVMPTDTVYGLAASAYNPEAVTRLYTLKHREHKPGTIIAASVEQLAELGAALEHLDMVKQWWPNPLSVVVPVGKELAYIHQGLDSLPMRIPKDETIRTLLEKTGPLVTSSANQPGEPESVNIHEAWNYFGEGADFYVDGGDLSGRTPSTIIRITPVGKIEVLRHGAVDINQPLN